ncbi:uncharacterized protein LOC122653917 [Telopea speciosissima]|uniref:uncharacterized protein LOC122653917 n=1 Tax=Telopea speciosissima TaxID=54955 RepID=UPI001CC4DCC3|nr:uncharacterized protein LOC122653917 [Telopea speciosissima]
MRSFLFTPKCLFVVCNIIIIFLVGESKLVGSSSPSPAADDIYDEYMKRSQSLRRFSSHEEKIEARNDLELPLIEETIKRVHEDEQEERGQNEGEKENSEGDNNSLNGEEEPGLPPDELKQRVEDFIARVNRQRRLEAEQLI